MKATISPPSSAATASARSRAAITLPTVLLAIGVIASGVLLIAWQSHLTFLLDDWDLLLRRRGFSASVFFDPHPPHLMIGPIAIYKTIQATFGMDSLLPFAVVATTTFLASVVLLFVYLKRRVGEWLALAGVVPILFLGSAFDDLLVPFQVSYFGSMALGIGALLALERRDAPGDALACGLLIGAFSFSSVGLPFLVGAAVAIALDRGPLSRTYVVLGPLLLYAAWYAGWGTGPSDLSLTNIANSPSYVIDGLATSLGSLLGLGLGGTPSAEMQGALEWGRPLLVGIVAAAALWVHSRGRAGAWLPVTVATALSFWFVVAANASLIRPPTASRLQYVGAVFLLMIAAECAAGLRLRWRGLLLVGVIAAGATASNLSTLQRAYQGLMGTADVVRGGLAGLELAADTVRPEFELTEENSDIPYFGAVDAGRYLSAASKFGSPAYPQDELSDAPEPARIAADKVNAAALGLRLRPISDTPPPSGPAPRPIETPAAAALTRNSCRTVRTDRPALVSLPPGGAALHASRNVEAGVRLRRFASSFPINLGRLRGTAQLDIPRDRSGEPWDLELSASGPVTVCGPATGPGGAASG